MSTRRKFLAAGLAGAGWVGVRQTGTGNLDAGEHLYLPTQQADKPAPIDKKLVSKFVGRSHGDLGTVKELVKQHPSIVNACWDWGGGDFETGLGAASHVGRRDIAEFLLEHGARLDLFAATMLGIKPIVAEALKTFPKLHAVPGPHQIPMLTHAIFGREKADDVFELLIKSGADVNAKSGQQMTPLMAAASVGRISIVEVLLKKNANPAAVTANGDTAVSMAEKRGHQKVAEFIKNAIKKQKG